MVPNMKYFEGVKQVSEFNITFQYGVVTCKVFESWKLIGSTPSKCGDETTEKYETKVGVSKEDVTSLEKNLKASIGAADIVNIEGQLNTKTGITFKSSYERSITKEYKFTSEKCEEVFRVFYQLVREYNFNIHYFLRRSQPPVPIPNIKKYLDVHDYKATKIKNSPECGCGDNGASELVHIEGAIENVNIGHDSERDGDTLKIFDTIVKLPKHAITSGKPFAIRFRNDALPDYILDKIAKRQETYELYVESVERIEDDNDREVPTSGPSSFEIALATVIAVIIFVPFIASLSKNEKRKALATAVTENKSLPAYSY